MAVNPPNGIRQRKWSDGAAVKPPTPSRGRRLFTVGLTLLALAAVLVAVLLLIDFWGTAPLFRSIPVTEYRDEQFPVNALAGPDSEALLKLFPGHDNNPDSQLRSQMKNELNLLKTVRADPVVLHLSALARADKTGVYLLPADAVADDPNTWLSLNEVLAPVHECRARHKLLILDIQRGALGPRLGLLSDAVGPPLFEALRQAVKEDPQLWILCPCSAGETSLTMDELPQSVFVHYLVRGLEGRADGLSANKRTDERVSLDELAAFVTAHVSRRAFQDRGIRQVPVLFGDEKKADDFYLTQVTVQTKPDDPAPELPPTPPYPEWLKSGWELRDRWAEDGTQALVPAEFLKWEAILLRAEHQYRGRNGNPEDVPGNLQKQRTALEMKAAGARRGVSRIDQPHTLAQAIAFGEKPPAKKDVESLRKLATEFLGVKTKEGPIKDAFKENFQKFREPFQDKPFALAWLALEAATEDPDFDEGRLQFYTAEWLKAGKPGTVFAETLALERVAGIKPDPRTKNWPNAEILFALRVERLAERAAVCWVATGPSSDELVRLEPRALPLVRQPMEEADRLRREAWKLLLGKPTDWPQAKIRLERLSGDYKNILDLIAALAKAERTRDEALALLPAYAAWLMTCQRPDPRDDTEWERAVDVAVDLALYLDRPTVPKNAGGVPAAIYELQKRTEDVAEQLRYLRKNVALELLAPPGGQATLSPKFVHDADGLLQISVLKAAERQTLWTKAREIALQLDLQTGKADRDDYLQKQRPKEPSGPTKSDDERAQRARQGRYLLGLLKLGGQTGLETLEQVLGKASSGDESNWHDLAAQFRAAGTRDLAPRLRELLKSRDTYRAADRLIQVASPFDRNALRPLMASGLEPALELRKDEARKLWDWLSKRCRAEKEALATTPTARDYYSQAGEDYLHSSK